MTTKLSVNVNKIALLRNSRGNDYPNLVDMAKRAIAAGAQGITVHPRPDERHITYADVPVLANMLTAYPHVEYNIEGYPNDEFMELVLAVKPHQCTLVPDKPGQLTSDHGWDVEANADKLKNVINVLQATDIRVSLFMDADTALMSKAKEVGAYIVELYTEAYARAFGTVDESKVATQYVAATESAKAVGLLVNAGHDLNLDNLRLLLQGGGIDEVSIGHAIMVESFDCGYEATIKKYVDIINSVS